MILSIEGEEKTGKTTTAYTAPLRIVGFQFDLGAERALLGGMFDKYFKGLEIAFVPLYSWKPGDGFKADITIFELPVPVQVDSTQVRGVREVWDYFLSIVGEAIRDPLVRSLVVDTMTLARRVKADAYLQALQEKEKTSGRTKLLQIEYGAPNSAIRDLFNSSNSVRKNLIAVHHLTNEYAQVHNKQGEIESQATGRRILEGLDQTYRYVDVALRLENKKGTVTAKLITCGYKLDLAGIDLTNPTWDGLVDLIQATVGDRIQFERRQEIA